MSKTKSDILNELFKNYNLVYDKDNPKDSDVFKTRNFTIITRGGVQKIQAALKINSKYDVVFVDPFSIIMKGKFSYAQGNGEVVETETFGESSVDRKQVVLETVSVKRTLADGTVEEKSQTEAVEIVLTKGNVQQSPAYLAAMAEKRALSRGVLQLAGLYEHGVFGEDEADDFKKEVNRARQSIG